MNIKWSYKILYSQLWIFCIKFGEEIKNVFCYKIIYTQVHNDTIIIIIRVFLWGMKKIETLDSRKPWAKIISVIVIENV